MKKCTFCGKEINSAKNDILKQYQIPFLCKKCGSLNFRYEAKQSYAFIWQDPEPDKIGSLYIPDHIKFDMINDYGIVLAIGKGYYINSGKFMPTEVKAEDRVVYDKETPYRVDVEAPDGKKYQVRLMPEGDIKGVLINGVIEPTGDRVLVKPDEAEEKSIGGIYLPTKIRKKSVEGKIIAIGKDTKDLKVNDKVLFERQRGNLIKNDKGEELLIFHEGHILTAIKRDI